MPEKFKGIYYQCSGIPGNTTVLFLHGFLGDNKDWQEVIDIVSKKYFSITIDLPGHNKSDSLKALGRVWDFESLTIRINDLLNHLSVEKVNLVGYSMGGRIAQHFAVHFPERIVKLVLESSSPGMENENEKRERLIKDKLLAKRLQKEPLKKFLDFWYEQSLFYGIKNHPKYHAMIKRRLANDPGLLARALNTFSVGNQSYLANKLSLLKIPLLLVCGEKDLRYLEIMQGLQQRNPQYAFYIMPGCGHNTHFEKPILFAEHLIEFLSL